MAQLTTFSSFSQQLSDGLFPNEQQYPVAAGATIFQGGMVALFLGFAKAANPVAAGSPELVVVGRCAGVGSNPNGPIISNETNVDNSAGANGAKYVRVVRGIFLLKNSAGVEAITQAHAGLRCYMVDDITVSNQSSNGKRPVMGMVMGITITAEGAVGVYVAVGYSPQERILQTLLSGADLSAHQFGAVKLVAGALVKCAAGTDVPYGVVQNVPAAGAGQEVQVCTWGPSFLKSEAAGYSTSVEVSSGANGFGKDAVANDRVIGIAQELAGASVNKMIYVRPGGKV